MSYTRNPLITPETYRRLIEHGLSSQTTRIVSIVVPDKCVDGLLKHFKDNQYTAFVSAARGRAYSRITVYDRELIKEPTQ
ncbi:MAG: hypothetical protein ACXWQ5_00125 [Ktedonobacterales bacterium]